MKFGKEFEAQMVQEWRQAYMDYNLLKSIVKDISVLRKQSSAAAARTAGRETSLTRKESLYRAFSGLTTTRNRNSPRRRDEEAILVGAVRQGGSEEDRYQTMFLGSADESRDLELVFFRKLDEEFNKVVSFYKSKVEEVVAEADELTRQMDVLIALRIRVAKPAMRTGDKSEDVANDPRKRGDHMEAIQEVEMSSKVERGSGSKRYKQEEIVGQASPEILENVKVYVEHGTPISALKGILLAHSSSELPFTGSQLRKSEELMVQAFVEFYQKLRLLKSYCFMNQLAFSKIMKKYDKVTLRNASKPYLDMVDKSYLGSSEEVARLIARVESAFIKHFMNGNRGKGMNVLRPKKKRDRHAVTFFLGSLFGCSLALVVTILVLIQSRNIIKSEGRGRYMENIFPLYSLFGFIVLHMIMLSGNMFYWRRYRVNYPFIFGLKEGTELGYREVFLLSAGLSVLTLAAVISNLDMDMDRRTNDFATLPELVPVILVGVLLLILFCPLNIMYRSTRFFLITCTLHCILAPLYKVTLPDFFLADQLTSQVQAIRSLQFYVCYYIWGNFKKRDSNKCLDSGVYNVFLIVVAIIPYWTQFLQCLRRLVEEKGSPHILNGLKYFLIIIAVSTRTLYEQKKGNVLLIIAAATSGIATIYATYWDLVVDWGLPQRKSKNRWLRDKLIVPNKAVYFIAIVLNCVLRLAWMQTVLGFTEAPFIHRKALISIVASLEIIRRGIWNFFRLENEHLNNVGKYRAFKSVPLPFNYEDGEKDS